MAKNKKHKESYTRRFIQFIEYNIAGLAFFWTSYAILVSMDYADSPLWLSSTVSYLVGLGVNFLLERYWVFRESQDGSAFETATKRYIAISAINLGFNYLILQTLDVLGVSIAIAPFISAAIFTPWNFVWYKYWVFAKEGKKEARKVAKKSATIQRKQKTKARKRK